MLLDYFEKKREEKERKRRENGEGNGFLDDIEIPNNEYRDGEWIVYNPGTEWLFAECSECGYEDNDTLFIGLMTDGENEIISRCPRCYAKLRAWKYAEDPEGAEDAEDKA